ncbi:uncharacterized protein LOC135159708 [Lytechinus pictus]|uniref:uncharacterized protein LOC135158988 n=1 Tax=Lytechinus pictus TaxID=7653 RepID=UPI0030BA098B
MSKRTADGKFAHECSNRLHVDLHQPLVPDVGEFVSVLEVDERVRAEWAEENKEKDRLLLLHVRQKKKRVFVICSLCHKYFKDRVAAIEREGTSKSEFSPLGPSSSATASTSSTTSTTNVRPTKNSPSSSVSSSTRVNQVIKQLESFEEEELAEVANFLGKSQRLNIKEDIKLLQKSSIDVLTSLDVKKWVNERNSVVHSFLKGIGPSHDLNQDLHLAKTIEQVYSLYNKKIVLPFSLSENLVVHAATRNKAACNVISSSSPAGSHTYILNWLKEQAAKPLDTPSGDILVGFDNDQVIGKSYHVRTDNKVKASVITSTCIAEVQPAGRLQASKDLKPGNWQTASNIAEKINTILDKGSDFNKAVDSTHYTQVFHSLQKAIDTVTEQQITKDSKLRDHVDDEIDEQAHARDWRVCVHCGVNNLRTKRVCISCSASLKNQTGELESRDETRKPQQRPESQTKITYSYQDIPLSDVGKSTCSSSKVKVHAGEPIFVNPNSHASVLKVLQEIGKQVKVKKYVPDGEREWVAVTCDGLPFFLAQRVLKETFTCQECKKAVFTRKAYESHCAEHDAYANVAPKDLPTCLEFDWVLLRIGHGHVEMNMVRSFFALNWDVCLKDLAKTMGFCSDNAQKYAKAGSDHHKSWEILQIMYYGSLQELVLPYVRECLSKSSKATPDGFLRWSRGVQKPQFKYLQEQILTYASAIMHLREGIRHNNMALVIAGRVKFAPIFHSRNHPKYQLIELVELSNFLAAPPAVQEFLRMHQALSTSGDPSRCEDLDFILEVINKNSKAWAPRGVPTEEDWLRIFRNLEKFLELRSAVFARMTSDDPEAVKPYTSSHKVHDEEITAWRTRLRSSNFLQDPFSEVAFESVSLEKLDAELVNLTEQATKRRQHFASRRFDINSGEDTTSEVDPVFVTEAERAWHSDIRNQKKEVIASRVLALIDSLDNESIRTMLLAEWESSVRQRKKDDFIAFFDRVQEEVSGQQLVNNDSEEDE